MDPTADRLSRLQRLALERLATLSPTPVLTGGAALAGFHTYHRSTKDLDLFWRARATLGDLPQRAAEVLREAGLEVVSLQTSPAFHRLRVSSGEEASVVDLVADQAEAIEPPEARLSGGTSVLVDSPHEILVNKLTTLLSRSEVRDLEDVRVLLDIGGDLRRALGDAPRKDGGFSALTLAWVLDGFAAERMALSLGWSDEQAARLGSFKSTLVAWLLAEARPPE